MNRSKTLSAQHLPRGTIVETSIYRQPREGEVGPQWSIGELKDPAQFTVDHILIADGWHGRQYMVVTTTPRPVDAVIIDELISFNISHVTRVVKRGYKTVVKTNKDRQNHEKQNPKNRNSRADVSDFISFTLSRLQPFNLFKIDQMVKAAIASGVISHRDRPDSLVGYYCYFNKRKLKVWIKRNQNRFIYSAKEMQHIQKLIDEDNAEYAARLSDFDYLYPEQCEP